MTSGGNSFNYFPENQLTKFIAVPPKISMTQRASFPPRMDAPGCLLRLMTKSETIADTFLQHRQWHDI